MITDPFIIIFIIVLIISFLYPLLNLTPILSDNPTQKKLFLFSIDIFATSVMFFLFIHFGKSLDITMIVFYTLAYLGIIFYKSSKFITVK